MNLGTKYYLSLVLISLGLFFRQDLIASTDSILRGMAQVNGLVPAEALNPITDPELALIGEVFFNSTNLSLNGETSCQTCHLDRFGSADGIPNAVGVGGQGEGMDRALGDGAILPRNTLALWGRGIDTYDTLFWDGRIQAMEDFVISQFGEAFPSNDPLVVAVHLPAVEIREMLIEDTFVTEQKQETYESAAAIYDEILNHLRETETSAVNHLAAYLEIEEEDVNYIHVAESIAEFIRTKFALQNTRFHDYVFNEGELTEDEFNGALLFYGKGRCSVCHSGSLFSDLQFHSIPFPQLGYGKNGFGIDYGRYNATHNPRDLYQFRTPPLLDVANTFPYSHSGGIGSLEEAITYHFDPLSLVDLDSMNGMERTEYYKKLQASSGSLLLTTYLNEEEVAQLISFLRTLSFTPRDISLAHLSGE